MRLKNILELPQVNNQYLYEGLDRTSAGSMLLWEHAGIKLREAALTADQIQQIFQNVEKGATDAGGNRTLLGKGKDAAEAVNKAWEDLKTKIQDSGPIKNVDNAYDSAVAKIEAGLGGPDNALNKVIQRYRKFAKEHPIAQGFIYSALIAAAGISGAGLGGAAVLGLLKLTDKLLQGEKFSSAAYSGAKTGAMAYGASKIGDYLKGKPEGEPSAAAATNAVGGLDSRSVAKNAFTIMKEKIANGEVTDYNSYTQAMEDAIQAAATNGAKTASFQSQETARLLLRAQLDRVAADAAGGAFSGSGPEKVASVIQSLGGTVNKDSMNQAIQAAASMRKAMGGESIIWSGKKLSEGQVYMIFNRVAREDIMEGPLDALKGMAGKAVDWAKTKGKNLTTKVTADKLNSAWKKAGSPMDSDQLATFLQDQGVDAGIVDKVYADLKLPTASDAAGDAGDQKAAPGEEKAKGKTDYASIKELVLKLDKKGKQRIAAYLQKQLGTA